MKLFKQPLGAIFWASLFLCMVYVQAGGLCTSTSPKLRQNCGFRGISKEQCESKGCCFDSSVRGVPWCFHGKAKEVCRVTGSKRQNCGFPGISISECERKGCCFDSSIRGVPWCFYEKDECSVTKEHRVICLRKVTAEQCRNVGCCFDGGQCFFGNSQEQTECGQVKLAKRIVGGSHASPGEWPWHVQMHVKGNSKSHYCSASLIFPNWVITAAHCVDGQRAEDIGLTLGELDLNFQSGNERTHGISKYIEHPDYGTRPLRYDFALMKLTKPVIMNDHVRMACLPRSTEKLPVGTVCWETGWGKISHYGQMSDYLKELEVIVVDPKSSPRKVHNTMFETKTRTAGHGTCRGDSGGPVVLEQGGRWYLEGVHSYGRSTCATRGQYDGQADVRSVLTWIINTMLNN